MEGRSSGKLQYENPFLFDERPETMSIVEEDTKYMFFHVEFARWRGARTASPESIFLLTNVHEHPKCPFGCS